ncbi:Ankyrin repeat-containing protein At3g12360 [Olea europaea subsp. europaea]|uniref:Ankyrin repeat-containing protein At3g12360 n=1 Tax=Olea europaea subsp. europaea TaxID=158383 RepID=A0A8S0SCD4_OLEEU|nr:Ankyrin repeat-containing protein At3g12360 [Olea europaea subsp. europaea]
MLYTEKNSNNNILHLAAKLAPSSRLNSVSGAALQMQRELQWFKEVEKHLRPSDVQKKNEDEKRPREMFTEQNEKLREALQEVEKILRSSDVQKKNKKGKTPKELFTEEHEELRKAGEDWMKNTTTSCMVVATLIATVALNASFTVPDGNKEAHNRWFKVFVTSNAVAMFSSTAFIMMFLSILTSRYGEEDFLFRLPAKLMVGLFTLFASIVCLVLKFSATYFFAYKEEKLGISPKIIAGLALLLITLYVILNFRLWISLIHSTIWASRFMFRPGKHRLF